MGLHPVRSHPAHLARGVDVAGLTLQALRDRLKTHVHQGIGLAPSWVRAGVLVPLVPAGDDMSLLFTQRTDTVLAHKGQISFPGGQQEPGDATLAQTALRETYEEIGLDPGRVTLLGTLDDVTTVVSGFVITPYVGVVAGGSAGLRPAPQEVKALLLVPINQLRDPAVHRSEIRLVDGQSFELHTYTLGEDVIWGATGRIVSQLLAIWEAA